MTFWPLLLEMISASPSHRSNRLLSTVTKASCIDVVLVPMRIVSPSFWPSGGRGPKWLWSIRWYVGRCRSPVSSQTTSVEPTFVLPRT